MSGFPQDSSSLPVRNTPHIRLNSGQHDPFADSEDTYSPGGLSAPPSRSLTPSQSPPVGGEALSPGLYSSHAPESSELLIPPSSRSHRSRDEYSMPQSPDQSGFSSRRTSWSSEAGSRDSRGYPSNPFDDSRAPSRAGSDDYDVNTQTVSEKYNIMPTEGLLLFPEDVEKDDYLHNPDPNDKDRDCDIFNRRGIINVGGLSILTLGILCLFIGYPVISFVQSLEKTTTTTCTAGDTLCLDVGKRSLLKNLRTGLIDPDTPDSAKTKTAHDGKEWKLVFSDEFNTAGRSFYSDDDAYFQAVDLWYGVTEDLEWYDPDAVTTKDGVLEIRFDHFENHDLDYRSGMVQSWNQLCFTGGRLEASISLPGAGNVSGFWPGFWSMGNLGRPGYAATTEGMWPYSYHDECDVGITPNQSSTDGISWLPGMRLPACTCNSTEHPSPGKSRSAPEIDVIEASVISLNNDDDDVIGVVSQSLQMAPFDTWYMPNYDFTAVYDDQITEINTYRGGPYQQAMSGLTNLNNKWYNGTEYQIYAYEYAPGAKGNVTWFVGENPVWMMDGRALSPNGNLGQRLIPMEPMAIVMNLGMSSSFATVASDINDYTPGYMRFDYVRIYQDPDSESVTCDPSGYETTAYIKKYPAAYDDYNYTTWAEAGYDWPTNSYVDGC
ncbi:hypothetical protein ASPZODRAFT_15773 [Penicilliopsis zonata CBS 506.65]|uniref:GH16 domain-containing protein n=1 Tax=Penicilliopsis zonata CBS 506.65 TaxID=1073090 RepID=A0A1L9SIN8_9EURO|nr:hypothetical protein ASPZODRAFT_15773 [Penicilliopsis zonata CBS 506.65]OJJ47090.1 hypothetical protein ASPZODRAFT_15773 [Penicilliopsis zonata CBS 506.65]